MVNRIRGKMFYGDATYDTDPHEYVLAADYDALAAELVKNEAAYNKAASARNDILAGLRVGVAALESSLKIQDEANAVLMRQVAQARDILLPLAGCDPAIRAWLRRTDLSAETKVQPPKQYACTCKVGECRKHRLSSNEYCHDDRANAGLAQEGK